MNDNIKEKKLKSSIEEALIHIKRMFYAGEKIQPFFPLAAGFLADIQDDEIEHIDQFVYRFMKLQDCLGLRLFPSILENLQEDFKKRPFIDLLNRLEQLEIIDNINLWQELRELRNNIAHEYPDNTDENTAVLNELYKRIPELYSLFEKAVFYIQKNIQVNIPFLPEWFYKGLNSCI